MTNQMVKKEESGLVALNDFKAEMGDTKLVNIRSEILKIPRLKLTQKMSKAADGLAVPGEFSCEVRGENYGSEVKIIPIMIRESASYLNKETSELICRTNDLLKSTNGDLCSNCPHEQNWADWGNGDDSKVPECKLSIDVICLVNDDLIPMELSFRKMSYKAGKSLCNMVYVDKMGVPFGSQYTLISSQATKDQWEFHVINPQIKKEIIDDKTLNEIIPVVKNFIHMEKAGKVERDETVSDDEPLLTPVGEVEGEDSVPL